MIIRIKFKLLLTSGLLQKINFESKLVVQTEKQRASGKVSCVRYAGSQGCLIDEKARYNAPSPSFGSNSISLLSQTLHSAVKTESFYFSREWRKP